MKFIKPTLVATIAQPLSTKPQETNVSKHNKHQSYATSQQGFTAFKHCAHDAIKPILIGGFEVHLGGRYHIPTKTVNSMDIVCPLNGQLPNIPFGTRITLVQCELQDHGGVPKEWPKFIHTIAEQILAGKKVMGYCVGGHGRTGTFAASLLAVLEPKVEDPIAEIRARYCKNAVETLQQADGVFHFKGGSLAPQNYEDEFTSWKKSKGGNSSGTVHYSKSSNSTQPTTPTASTDLKTMQKHPEWKDFIKNGRNEEAFHEYLRRKHGSKGAGNTIGTPIMTGDAEGDWRYIPGVGLVNVAETDIGDVENAWFEGQAKLVAGTEQ